MKKITTLCMAVLLATITALAATKTTETFQLAGKTRSYLQYIPSSYNAETPSKVLVLLHGLNGNMNFFENQGYYLATMADATNTIILSLQALDEQDAEVTYLINTLASFQATTFTTTGVWGAGVSIPVSSFPSEAQPLISMFTPTIAAAGKAQLNKDVDDVAYINEVITKTKNAHNVNNEKVFMLGVSMGGAMAYKYAFSTNPQIAAMAIINGFKGAEVSTAGNFPVATCHFHSTNDEVVQYNGTAFNTPIQDLVTLLSGKNHTTSAEVIAIPNATEEDNMTVTANDYQTVSKPRFLFYKIEGANHMLAGLKDIEIFTEAWKFFNNEPILTAINDTYIAQVTVAPNPTSDYIYLSVSGNYTIYSLQGNAILAGNALENEAIAVGHLPKGLYVISIENNGILSAAKIAIK
jgi:poly(3-hydroxybutyrate) depolymerase